MTTWQARTRDARARIAADAERRRLAVIVAQLRRLRETYP